MRKHTPGPWQECGHARGGCSCGLVYAADFVVADVSPNSEGMGDLLPSIEARKANARLIAAAPELLEALEDALPMMGWSNMSDAEIQHEANEGNGTAPVIQKMRAAIAKAIGES